MDDAVRSFFPKKTLFFVMHSIFVGALSFPFSLPTSNSDLSGVTKQALPPLSPPLPTTVRAFAFYRENVPAVSPLAGSHKIALTDAATCSKQLIPIFVFHK